MNFDDDTRKKTAKKATEPAQASVASPADVRPKQQIPDAQKQKVVDDVKNVLNQTKPVEDYFGSGAANKVSENKAEYSASDASRRRLREGVTDLRTDLRTDGQTLL